MKKITMLCAIIPLVCFAGEIIRTFNFAPDDIEVKSNQGYDYILLKGCSNLENPGEPSLPYKSLTFSIPASAVVTAVNVVRSSKSWLADSYLVYPAQTPVPVSYSGTAKFTTPDPSIYESNEFYPGELLRNLPVGNMNGFRIAQLLIFPIQYLPKERRIQFYNSITIRVSFKEHEYPMIPKSESQIENFGRVVKTIVENPEDVDSYAPRVRESKPYLINTPYPIENVKIQGKAKIVPAAEEQREKKSRNKRIEKTTSEFVMHKPWLEALHTKISEEAYGEGVLDAFTSSPRPYANEMDQTKPNLTYYTPDGWHYPVIPSSAPGTHTVGPDLKSGEITYIDWAIINNGSDTARYFYTYLYSDSAPLQGWYTDSLPPNWYVYVEDYEHVFSTGIHILMTFADSTNVIDELNEDDNKYERAFIWDGGDIGWEHVIITNNSLKSDWSYFRSFIRSTYGVTDTVITTEYIYSNYSGADNQEKIRNFIIDAVSNNSTEYILLGGDVEIIPFRKTFCLISGASPWNDTIPCDLYYADLDGDWDGNNNGTHGEPDDSVDMYPDVWLGRATVNRSTDIARFAGRFADYYNTTTHQTKILLAGFDLDGVTYGETTMEQYSSDLPPGYLEKKVYDSHPGNHRDSVRTALDDGQNITFHIDHGDVSFLCCGDYNHGWRLYNSDMDGLTNLPEYAVFTSLACLIGAFDQSDCIMEHFMNASSGGAVCGMTNSRFGWFSMGQNPQTSYTAHYLRRFFDRIFGHSPARGVDFLLGKADLIPNAIIHDVYRSSMYALNLFGDPLQTIHVPYTIGVEEEELISSNYLSFPTEQILVTPNLFSNSTILRINLAKPGELMIYLFDITGRQISSKAIDYKPEENVFNLEELIKTEIPCGIYFLHIETEEGNKHTEKIIKIK